jgi:parallel beta-helix repeat protein
MPGIESRLSRQQRRALERERGTAVRKGAAVASGAALAVGALAAGPPAEAATFNVTNLNDNGAGSLRQAIVDANNAAGADMVTFQAGLTGTITLTSGQLYITDSVDIQGPGAAVITVSGNNSSRVFYLYTGSALIDVTISGLTITGGNAPIGAGVVNFDENLVLDAVTITGNTATGDGGGLWADGFSMNLTIRSSTISGNTAGSDGGGIYIEDTGGPLLIQNTVISGNTAADDGGGIYFYDPDTSTTIEGSTISGNTAGDLGGGIHLYDTDGGTHTIRQTTISGNSATNGGGLFLYGPDNPFVIENSTISGNQATAGDGGGAFFYNLYAGLTLRHVTVAGNSASGTGGGLFSANSSVTVGNSIVGDNTAASNPDLGNGAESGFDLSFTLVESPGTANINDNGGNIFNQDPQLGPLQGNGGPTQTHMPAGASPAVDAGNNADSLPADQRGVARPVGATVDMGAVEVSPGTIQLTVNAVSVNENAGTVTITATRTGGTDGAVSVSYTTTDGTAVAPGDYAAAAGSLNWANGDGAPKSFQVTIVNDTADEADETFNAIISNPQGGAGLGAITTEVVTIVDDDAVAGVADIPTLGDVGRLLFAGLAGLAGYLKLRRRKDE